MGHSLPNFSSVPHVPSLFLLDYIRSARRYILNLLSRSLSGIGLHTLVLIVERRARYLPYEDESLSI